MEGKRLEAAARCPGKGPGGNGVSGKRRTGTVLLVSGETMASGTGSGVDCLKSHLAGLWRLQAAADINEPLNKSYGVMQ